MDKANPTGTGALSLNRKSETTVGENSISLGTWNIASASKSTAIGGSVNEATGESSFIGGGYNNDATGKFSGIVGGYLCNASGQGSFASGNESDAGSDYQFVHGKYNIVDTNNLYSHIIGNGTSRQAKSNAYTLDWDGNAWFAGDVTSELSNVSLASIETGSWTPVVDGVITTTAIGSYMKVGNLVTINFFITGVTKNSTTNSTGFVNITGIPFEASTDVLWYAGGGHWQGGYINQDAHPNGNFSGYVLQPSDNTIFPRVSSSATTGTIAAGSGYYIVNSGQTNTVHASGSIMYKIA